MSASLANGDPTVAPSTASNPAPTHPGLLRVERGVGAFSSRAVSETSLPAGSLFATMAAATPEPTRSYTTVQSGKSSDIELNSDLVFCNHSCDPSLEFDMARQEVRVVPGRDLKKGDDLTFFYPSTEWDMAQPFACNCGSQACVGTVRGARYLESSILQRYWLNEHIKDLLTEAGVAHQP